MRMFGGPAMNSNLDKYKTDLKRLIDLGGLMELDLLIRMYETRKGDNLGEKFKEIKDDRKDFNKEYQRWYTEAHAVVEHVIPARLREFGELYQGNGKRKSINVETFNIQDWMLGRRSEQFDDSGVVLAKFITQMEIMRSSFARFESSLFDIKQLLQADLFDSELAAARALLKNGFLRGAGALTGVVLERHLGQVCTKHRLAVRKRNPSISDWNDLLKKQDCIDVPSWRFIQRLGDLRNLCSHNKDRPPTEEEVRELIDGTEKIVKTLF
jgi:hypothetical protein